jgi:hypothetical protein
LGLKLMVYELTSLLIYCAFILIVCNIFLKNHSHSLSDYFFWSSPLSFQLSLEDPIYCSGFGFILGSICFPSSVLNIWCQRLRVFGFVWAPGMSE